MQRSDKMRKGVAFENEIKETLEKVDSSYYYKFPDTHAIRGLTSIPTAFFPRVPADFLFVVPDKVIFLECKSSHNENSYNFVDFVKEEQIETALRIERVCGKQNYYFLINNRAKRNGHYVVLLGSIEVKQIRDMLKFKNQKSLKWSCFSNIGNTFYKCADVPYRNMIEYLVTK